MLTKYPPGTISYRYYLWVYCYFQISKRIDPVQITIGIGWSIYVGMDNT